MSALPHLSPQLRKTMKINQTESYLLSREIFQNYQRDAGDWRREHLGASILGHRCDRYLWLSFRWAAKPDHSGRMLRLFERGNREEEWVVRDLRRAGLKVEEVDPETGEQFRVGSGHYGGSVDGLVTGLPSAEDDEETHVLEIKTSNKKSFERLKKKRVRSAQPKHYVQMQLYMDGLQLEHALYVCVCKDSDEIYIERVAFDQKIADKNIERGYAIIDATEPPAKLSREHPPCVLTRKEGTRYPCQYWGLCHGSHMPERNCRTCVSSTPGTNENGEPTWSCAALEEDFALKEQREGCDCQMSIPSIVNADVLEVDEDNRQITYQFDDGEQVTEGRERE